jgi:poly(beta-D-mannuronate) lyase
MKLKFLKAALIGLVLSTSSLFNVANATLINVALNGTATQSSTGWGGSASRAIDGNTSGLYGNNSVTHTMLEDGAWWEVDLGSSFLFTSIVIWNRTDCCHQRLNNYKIELFDTNYDYLDGISSFTAPTPSATFSPFSASLAQYVRVTLLDEDYLSLAEVQVFSKVPEPAALALLGLGLVGLGLSRRKKAIR